MEDTAKPAGEKTAPRRFLFNQSFDVERQSTRKRKQEEEKPPEPTFSKEELEAARQAGYEEGRTAGLQEAGAGLEAATADLVKAIAEQLPMISTEQAASNDRLMHDGARVATIIARKILPAYAVKYGTDELESLVTQCLRSLVDQPRIVVRVEPAQVAPITQHLENAVSSSGFDGRFLVEADETMGPSDCRLAWQGGGLERRESDIWRDIDAAIGAYLGDAAAGDGPDATVEADMPDTAEVTADPEALEAKTGADGQVGGETDNDGTTPAPEAGSVDVQAESPDETAGDMPAGDNAGAPDPLEDR